jgi:hypothetical protein
MGNLLRAATGEISDVDTVAGPDSYPTGGFSIKTSLGRISDTAVSTDAPGYEAREVGAGDPEWLRIEVHSQDGTSEVAGGTDLSGDNFTYQAFRL